MLSHPNGWWRDTAQQLLVQRGDKSVAPQLKQLAGQTADWRVKLHAMWTLDGLDAIEPDVVQKALADKSADVRAAAIRLSERWLNEPNSPLAAAILKLASDPSWTVRRQLAATVGELPQATRLEPAAMLLSKYGSDPILVDVTISGLRGSEGEVLNRVLQPNADAGEADAVSMLAAAIAKSGDVPGIAADCGARSRRRRSRVAARGDVAGARHGSPSEWWRREDVGAAVAAVVEARPLR